MSCGTDWIREFVQVGKCGRPGCLGIILLLFWENLVSVKALLLTFEETDCFYFWILCQH